MFIAFIFCCFLVVASSDGAVTTKERAAVNGWLHKVHKRHSSHLGVRQSNISCDDQFEMNLTLNCDFTELSDGVLNLPFSSLTDAQLTTLNNAYSRFCVSTCIDLYIAYYNCILTSDDGRNYFTTYIRHGMCGQESGDYCVVRYIRQYRGNYSDYQSMLSSCPSGKSRSDDTGEISCSSATSTCLSYVGTFSDRMGCCTEPYLGSGVNSCSGVSVDDPCTGVSSATEATTPTGVSNATEATTPTGVSNATEASSATGLVAPVFVMILSLVGFLV